MVSLRTYFSILWHGPDLGSLKSTDGLGLSNDDIVRYQKWQRWYQRLLEGTFLIALIGLWTSGILLVNNEHSVTTNRMLVVVLVGCFSVLTLNVLLLHEAGRGLAFSSLSTSKYGCDETLKKCASSEEAEHYRRHVTDHREVMVLDAWIIARLAKNEQDEIAFKQRCGAVD